MLSLCTSVLVESPSVEVAPTVSPLNHIRTVSESKQRKSHLVKALFGTIGSYEVGIPRMSGISFSYSNLYCSRFGLISALKVTSKDPVSFALRSKIDFYPVGGYPLLLENGNCLTSSINGFERPKINGIGIRF